MSPNVTCKSPVASYEPNTEAKLEQLIVEMAQASPPSQGRVERGPDGRPIWLHLEMPDTASPTAILKLTNNPAIVNPGPMVPEPLFIFDLTHAPDPDGITLSGVTGMQDGVTAGPDAMSIWSASLITLGVKLGEILGTGNYADFGENTAGRPATILRIVNLPQVSDANIVIPNAGIQLSYDGNTLDLVHNQITIGQGAAENVRHFFWIDSVGRLYHHFRSNDPNLPDINPRTFEQAVAYGPV